MSNVIDPRPPDDLGPLCAVIGARLDLPDNAPRVRWLARIVAALLPVLLATPPAASREVRLEFRRRWDLPRIVRSRPDYDPEDDIIAPGG